MDQVIYVTGCHASTIKGECRNGYEKRAQGGNSKRNNIINQCFHFCIPTSAFSGRRTLCDVRSNALFASVFIHIAGLAFVTEFVVAMVSMVLW